MKNTWKMYDKRRFICPVQLALEWKVSRKVFSLVDFFGELFPYLHKTPPKGEGECRAPKFSAENPCASFREHFGGYYDACTFVSFSFPYFVFRISYLLSFLRFWPHPSRPFVCVSRRVVGFSGALGLITAFSTLGHLWIIMLFCCGAVIPLSMSMSSSTSWTGNLAACPSPGANLNACTIFNLHANGGEHFPSHLVVDGFPFCNSFWSRASWSGVLVLSEVVVSVSQFPIK